MRRLYVSTPLDAPGLDSSTLLRQPSLLLHLTLHFLLHLH